MYRNVLVPLDGSEFAESALEHVGAVTRTGTLKSVILVRVVTPLLVHAKDMIEAEHAREVESKQEAAAKRYLDKVASRLRAQGLPVSTELVIDGDPATKILETARERGVDLIVMSTHGSAGIAPWLFGSVTHRVLAHSPVPVLMVVPKGARPHKS